MFGIILVFFVCKIRSSGTAGPDLHRITDQFVQPKGRSTTLTSELLRCIVVSLYRCIVVSLFLETAELLALAENTLQPETDLYLQKCLHHPTDYFDLLGLHDLLYLPSRTCRVHEEAMLVGLAAVDPRRAYVRKAKRFLLICDL